MGEQENCNLCGGKLVKKEERVLGGTNYDILKCEKCSHVVAKNRS